MNSFIVLEEWLKSGLSLSKNFRVGEFPVISQRRVRKFSTVAETHRIYTSVLGRLRIFGWAIWPGGWAFAHPVYMLDLGLSRHAWLAGHQLSESLGWIGRGGLISWSACSLDLTPLDFWLGGWSQESSLSLQSFTHSMNCVSKFLTKLERSTEKRTQKHWQTSHGNFVPAWRITVDTQTKKRTLLPFLPRLLAFICCVYHNKISLKNSAFQKF